MNISEKTYQISLLNYRIMKESGIPTSEVISYGAISKDQCYYVLFNFSKLKEIDNKDKFTSCHDGYVIGKKVAEHLIHLKGKSYDGLPLIDKNKLYEKINTLLDEVFKQDGYSEVLPYSREKLKKYIDIYIESFNDEPIDLIHTDVKFGNILYDDVSEMIFVDNESLAYGYDIINFFYNIHERFRKCPTTEVYRGFLNGYLKYMNNGKIPKRIEGQIKLLLIFNIIMYSLRYLQKLLSNERIEELFPIYEDYIFNNKPIEWLE